MKRHDFNSADQQTVDLKGIRAIFEQQLRVLRPAA